MPNFSARTKLVASALFACAIQAQDPAPFRADTRLLRGVDLIELADGQLVRLSGISLPATVVRPAGYAAALREHLATRLEKRQLWFYPEPSHERGDPAQMTALVREREDQPSINEETLALGLALYDERVERSRESAALVAAGQRAQREKRGWFAGSAARAFSGQVPFLNGAVLPLYDRNPGRDYHRHLDELAEAGFRHVELLFAGLVPDVNGFRIDRHNRRTVTDARLVDTIDYAKKKGMSVLLLPIVLLEEQTPDDWRGVLKPSDEQLFWQSYDAFLCHYLDIGERHGVELFSLGSELGSLEDSTRTHQWKRLIRSARGRFGGMLTYSANWDHIDTARFFGDLDVIGMTAYFSLTDEHKEHAERRNKAPTKAQLEAGWRKVGAQLKTDLAALPKPVFFTELGYASQDGANSDPWDYFLINTGRIDLQEQADCFAAFLAVAPELEFLKGAYFFDYFDEGGPRDSSYSPRGKPAMEQWRKWAAVRR